MVLALAMAGVSAGCSDGNGGGQPARAQSARKAVRAEIEGYYGNYVDTIAVAKLAGYDYLAIVTDCLLRDDKAMHKLFEMTAAVPFDAIASEGNSEVLGFVLRDVGDRFFGQCLSAEEPAVQRTVREALLYDLGYDGDYEAKGQHINRLYPHTYPDANGL